MGGDAWCECDLIILNCGLWPELAAKLLSLPITFIFEKFSSQVWWATYKCTCQTITFESYIQSSGLCRCKKVSVASFKPLFRASKKKSTSTPTVFSCYFGWSTGIFCYSLQQINCNWMSASENQAQGHLKAENVLSVLELTVLKQVFVVKCDTRTFF